MGLIHGRRSVQKDAYPVAVEDVALIGALALDIIFWKSLPSAITDKSFSSEASVSIMGLAFVLVGCDGSS